MADWRVNTADWIACSLWLYCCLKVGKVHHCWVWFAANRTLLLRTVSGLRSPPLNKVLIFRAGSLSKSELIFQEESLCIVRGATQVFPNVQVCVHCQTYDDIRFFIVCHCIPKVKIRLRPMVRQGDRIRFRGGSIGWMRHFSWRVVFLWHLVDFKGKRSPCLLAVARGEGAVSHLCWNEDMSLPLAQILTIGRFGRFTHFYPPLTSIWHGLLCD